VNINFYKKCKIKELFYTKSYSTTKGIKIGIVIQDLQGLKNLYP